MPRRREGPRRDPRSGVYFFDQYVGFKPQVRRVRLTLRTKDPVKAQWLWEQEFRRQWSLFYGIKTPSTAGPVSLVDASREFVAHRREIKRIKEWRVLRFRLNIVLDIWGNINLADIGRERLSLLDARLREMGRSENTINHYFDVLKALFNFAAEKKLWAGENPIKEVTPYIIDQKRRAYSSDEIGRIIAAAGRIEREAGAHAEMQKVAKTIVLLLLYIAMRMGELLNLKWSNVRGDKIVLRRSETKSRKEKIVPIAGPVARILAGLEKRRRDAYVLPLRRRGGEMRAGWADSLIRKIRKYSEVDDFIFHGLRHTAATIMASEVLGKGVGLIDIMKILGHSKTETTLGYQHADFSRMKKAMEILANKTIKDN
jgi:integrase